MKRIETLIVLAGVGLASAMTGCESTRKSVMIRTFPEGAVVWVDDEPRGQTNFEKLVVDFKNRESVILRIEKDGYQSEGQVLARNSTVDRLTFFLDKSPENEVILRRLSDLQQALDSLSEKVEVLDIENGSKRESQSGGEEK